MKDKAALDALDKMKTEVGQHLRAMFEQHKILEANAFIRYHFLDQVWFVMERVLPVMLPATEEARKVQSTFAGLRFDIHDILSAEAHKDGSL